MLRGALKLGLISAFATAGIAFYLFPDAQFMPSWLKMNFTSLPVKAAMDGPSLGLRISLILVTFYLAQGSLALLSRKSSVGGIPFHFMEIPTLLACIIMGVAYVPNAAIKHYVTFLAGFSPLLTLLELTSAMTVIMASGRAWNPIITESSTGVKITVLLLCLVSFIASYGVIYSIYSWMNLSTLVASLLSSIGTLAFVEIIACCCVDHATITDLGLLLPYIAYNLGLIALREARNLALENRPDAPFIPKRRIAFLALQSLLSWNNTLSGVVKEALSAIFSPILIFHLIFQLCILVIAAAIEAEDEREMTPLGQALHFTIKTLWPLFGKCFLVLIYTVAWLDQSHPSTFAGIFKTGQLPFYLDAICFWRWFVVFGALAWYGKHLIFDDSRGEEGYQCDRNFWQQFHNFKE